MIRRGGIARRGPDLQRLGIFAQPRHGRRRQEVRLAGRRAHPEQRSQPALAELAVQLELLPRDVVEPAEVDVVRTRDEGALHHRQVEPVVGAVDADRAPLEDTSDGGGIRGVDLLLPLQPRVTLDERRLPGLEEARDVAPDRARCSDDGNHGSAQG
jgi:hypothetical protein